MAVGKYLDSLMLNLFFCLSLLLIESYAQRDQNLSIWDSINDKNLDNIFDKDRYDLKGPTLPPDALDHHKLQAEKTFSDTYYILLAVGVFLIHLCFICILCCCFSPRKRTTLNTMHPTIVRHDLPRSYQSLSTITQSDRSHIIGEHINVVSESGISTVDRPSHYDNPRHVPPRSYQSSSLSTNRQSDRPQFVAQLHNVLDESDISTVHQLPLYDNARYDPPRSYPGSPSSAITQSERLHIVVEFRNHIPEPSTSIIDQPPGYEDIIRTELSGKENFPIVRPPTPDTPPPDYKDLNTQ